MHKFVTYTAPESNEYSLTIHHKYLGYATMQFIRIACVSVYLLQRES